MGKRCRPRKIKLDGSSFDTIFNVNKSNGTAVNNYASKIIVISDGRANPCNECGHYPRIHDVTFMNKEGHQKHIYFDCGTCMQADGEWYETIDEAINKWNELNPLKDVPVNKELTENRKFINSMVDDIRFIQ